MAGSMLVLGGQGVTVFQGTALYAKSASKNSQTYQGELQSLGQAEQFMAKLGLVYVTIATDCQTDRSKSHFGVRVLSMTEGVPRLR